MASADDNRQAPFISLRLKVVLSLLLVLSAGFAVGLKLATGFQARYMLKHVERESRTMAGFVKDSISQAMLRGDADQVRDILLGLSRNEKVLGVRLTNYEGIIVVSSRPGELGGKIPDLYKAQQYNTSSGAMNEEPMPVSGKPGYSHTIRFDNGAQCRNCHVHEGPVLGWLTVEMSTGEAIGELRVVEGGMAAGAALLGLAIALVSAFVLTRMVNRPIEELASAMKKAEADPDVRVHRESNDEIKVLSDGFNSLMTRLNEARAEAERLHSDELGIYFAALEAANIDLDDKVKKLSALSVIGRNMIETRRLEDLLKMVLDTALRDLRGESGSVMLYEKGVDELIINCGMGLSPEGHRKNRFMMGEGMAGWVAKHGKSAIVKSAMGDARYTPGRGAQQDVALMCVPMLGTKGNVLGVINIERAASHQPFAASDLEYLTAISGQASVAIENVDLIQNLQKSYYDTISALAMTVEAKDPYTLGHSKRVTQYAMAIADEMGLSEEDIQTIQYGSTLHDIGKIGVRGAVLNKQGSLSPEEFEEIMDHSVIGDNIVKGVDFLQKTRPIIRNHQERYDGKGYPDGLSGDDIPLSVAIVSVADNFDALTTDRPYRAAFPANEVIGMIKEESGRKFHPDVVEAFLRIFEG